MAVDTASSQAVTTTFESPVGPLTLTAEGGVLTRLDMGEVHEARSRSEGAAGGAGRRWLEPVTEQLSAYFAGDQLEFDLLTRAKGTEFQRRVWAELSRIPYGTTASYGQIAERIGSPKACRAVGLANHQNPIAIIVPCHRVIGADGSLTGYGGGLERKRWLLAHEARHRPPGPEDA